MKGNKGPLIIRGLFLFILDKCTQWVYYININKKLLQLIGEKERNYMSIKDLRNLTGLSQKEFGKKYDIPYRTIQNWETEQRSCPEYVENLLERVVLEDSGKREGYVFSWATSDLFDDVIYTSKYDAMKEAYRVWYHSTRSEKREYQTFMIFKIICTAKEWDELVACESDFTAADRLECVIKDYLHIMTKE